MATKKKELPVKSTKPAAVVLPEVKEKPVKVKKPPRKRNSGTFVKAPGKKLGTSALVRGKLRRVTAWAI